jgi:branched-chain amino acid transport system substrate-binding protein
VAQKLVDAKVNGVIGHLNSGTTVPASKIYNDAGIPQISPATTQPKYTQQGFLGLPRGRQRRQAGRHAGQVRGRQP